MPEISDQDYRMYLRLQDVASKYDGVDGVAKKIEKLEKDNAGYRAEIATLKTQLPADGTVAVPQDQAAALERYTALGKPDDLSAAIAERDTLKAAAAESKRKELLRRAGKLAFGSDTAGDVLDRVRGSEGWKIEIRQEQDGDTVVDVPYVTAADEPAAKLAEYAAAKLPEILPALKAAESEAASDAAASAGGTAYVAQGAAAGQHSAARTPDDFHIATKKTADYTL